MFSYTRPVYESVVYLDQVGRVGLLPVRAAALFDEPSFGFIAATTGERMRVQCAAFSI